MYRSWLSQVRRAQPGRVVILPGELGARCDGLGGGNSLSSSAALVADAEALSTLAQEGMEAATARSGGCNRVWWRLQPRVVEAATAWSGGCNRVEWRLQP